MNENELKLFESFIATSFPDSQSLRDAMKELERNIWYLTHINRENKLERIFNDK